MATNIIHLKCQNCGAALDLDMDNLIAYCPYCGRKLLFDIDQLGNILIEKEKTKQKVIDRDIETKRIENERKKNRDNNEIKYAIICFGFMALMIALGALALK